MDKIHDKLKIFIRYPPGASGNFISAVVFSLIVDIQLRDPRHAHYERQAYSRFHNWHNTFSQDNDDFRYTTSPNCLNSMEDRCKYIQETFSFAPTHLDYYIVSTHSTDTDPLLLAFNNTRLINIEITEKDRTQIAYNWLTKFASRENNYAHIINYLKVVKHQYGKLFHVSEKLIGLDSDPRLLTYIVQTATTNYMRDYMSFKLSSNYPILNIPFSDIANGNLVNRLDEIIDFVNIPNLKRQNALKLINQYVNAQTPAPWNLSLDDY